MNVTLDVSAAVWLAGAGDKSRRVSRGRLVILARPHPTPPGEQTLMVAIPSPDPTGWKLYEVAERIGPTSAALVDTDGKAWQATWRAKSCGSCAMRTAVMQIPADTIAAWVEEETAGDPEHEELADRADTVGLTVDGRWSIDTLRAKVEEAETAEENGDQGDDVAPDGEDE